MLSGSLAGQERRRFAYHAISYVTQRGLPLLATFLVAHVLGVREFGFFIAALTSFSALTLFVDLGLSISATSQIGILASSGQMAAIARMTAILAVLTIVLGLSVSTVMMLNESALSRAVLGESFERQFVTSGAVYVPALALALVMGGVISGLRNYGALAAIGAIGGTLYVLAVVSLAVGFGASGALWGASIGVVLRAALSVWFVRRTLLVPDVSWNVGILKRESAQLVSVALPASIAALAFTPVNAVLLAILFRHPNGPSEVGAFGIAQQLFSVALIGPGLLTQFFLPRMAEASAAAREIGIKILVRYAGYSGAISLAIGIPIMAFPELFLGLFGEEYKVHQDMIRLMMFASIISAPQGVFSNYMLVRGMNWLRVATWFIWGIVIIIVMSISDSYTARSAAGAYCWGWGVLTALQGLSVLFIRGNTHR